jgi:hypothetical protein
MDIQSNLTAIDAVTKLIEQGAYRARRADQTRPYSSRTKLGLESEPDAEFV